MGTLKPAYLMTQNEVLAANQTKEWRHGNEWRMPIDEEEAEARNVYVDQMNALTKHWNELAKSSKGYSKRALVPRYHAGEVISLFGFHGQNMHVRMIRRAIKAGKQVPTAVLESYPNVNWNE